MIACTVCGTQNDEFAVICASCKSFLQTKVDNLNLFETLWSLMESPRTAFRRIALARHKNYVILLSCLLGIALVYGVFWFKTLGARFPDFMLLVGAGVVAGPFVGILFTMLLSVIVHRVGRLLGGTGSYRNVRAATVYASVPIVYSLVLVFPVEIAIFGPYLFSDNPPPLVINPAAYIVLLGFDGAALLWSLALLVEGTIVVNGFSRGKAVVLAAIIVSLTSLALYGLRFA
ncbi:MAG TPA: Yip1 family protein [Bacteroidota bacterium]|nr:Yip1 family protein [Bacteroidota bacterium]